MSLANGLPTGWRQSSSGGMHRRIGQYVATVSAPREGSGFLLAIKRRDPMRTLEDAVVEGNALLAILDRLNRAYHEGVN